MKLWILFSQQPVARKLGGISTPISRKFSFFAMYCRGLMLPARTLVSFCITHVKINIATERPWTLLVERSLPIGKSWERCKRPTILTEVFPGFLAVTNAGMVPTNSASDDYVPKSFAPLYPSLRCLKAIKKFKSTLHWFPFEDVCFSTPYSLATYFKRGTTR